MTDSVASKNAIVVSRDLPVGLAVNAASVLAVTLGERVEGLVGSDVQDCEGVVHPGIIYSPLPVLTADPAVIHDIVAAALPDDSIFCVAFSSLAQSCKTYDEYIQRMAQTLTTDLAAVAVALVGPKNKVNKLVGSLPLLR
jgi:hypothetical protein